MFSNFTQNNSFRRDMRHSWSKILMGFKIWNFICGQMYKLHGIIPLNCWNFTKISWLQILYMYLGTTQEGQEGRELALDVFAGSRTHYRPNPKECLPITSKWLGYARTEIWDFFTSCSFGRLHVSGSLSGISCWSTPARVNMWERRMRISTGPFIRVFNCRRRAFALLRHPVLPSARFYFYFSRTLWQEPRALSLMQMKSLPKQNGKGLSRCEVLGFK